MKCPRCGDAELVERVQGVPYVYKGAETKTGPVKGQFCPACGECVLSAAESQQISEEMLAFNRKVDLT